jgi:hypothetical protein
MAGQVIYASNVELSTQKSETDLDGQAMQRAERRSAKSSKETRTRVLCSPEHLHLKLVI